MSDIINALKEIFSRVLRVSTEPNDVEFIINETIVAAGKEFDLYKLLGGNLPNLIQIYCNTQNFTLAYSTSDASPNKTWPRTLALGSWHSWRGQGYYRITITPAAGAAVDGYISGTGKRKKVKFNGRES